MKFDCQKEPLIELYQLSKSRRQSVLIEGATGCGKSYLAFRYGDMLDIRDKVTVDPIVSNIRSTIESLINVDNDVLICIENLDKGLIASSNALLKFLEEPPSNIFIVVTCSNIYKIPDTIRSRSTVVSVSFPSKIDLKNYMVSRDSEFFKILSSYKISRCIKTFKDADILMNMNESKLVYLDELSKLDFSDSISTSSWKLSHFPDNSGTPISIVIYYIMSLTKNRNIHRCCISCLDDLIQGKIPSHIIISRLCMEIKYIN